MKANVSLILGDSRGSAEAEDVETGNEAGDDHNGRLETYRALNSIVLLCGFRGLLSLLPNCFR